MSGMLRDIYEYRAQQRRRMAAEADRSTWPTFRRTLARILEAKLFDLSVGLLIVSNVVLIVIEVDASARCTAKGSDDCGPPDMVHHLNHVFLGLYTAEAALRFYVYRCGFLCSFWNNIDIFIVLCGVVDLTLSSGTVEVPSLQVLRIFRVLRLLRAVRLLSLFPELREMFFGMACAMKAMFWGVMMILLMLGVWSLLAVELVNVRNKPEDFPEHCDDAFSTVLKSTHFFFQVIIAGEGYSECIRPLVDTHSETFFVFAGAVVTMQLGVMNLILTVIVQEVANARERDQEERLKDKKYHEQDCFKRWHGLICQLDQDSSGTITKEELLAGFKTQTDVQHLLALLDIEGPDLEQLFDLMDSDNSGDVSYNEFFDTLRKAHSQDVRTTLFNLRLQVSQIPGNILKQVEQTLANDRDVFLRSLHKQFEDWFEPAKVEQKFASDRDDILSSLHKQLEDRLERASQGLLENTARLNRHAEALDAVLGVPQLDEEVRARAPAASTAKRTLSQGSEDMGDAEARSLPVLPAFPVVAALNSWQQYYDQAPRGSPRPAPGGGRAR